MLYKFETKEGNPFVFDGDNILLLEQSVYDRLNKTNNLERSRFYSNLSGRFPYALAINMVNDCNLRCEYCYANSGTYGFEKTNVNISHVKKAIDYIVKTVKKNESDFVKLVFFGGEPLLAFEQIKEIVSYTKESHPDIKFRYGTVTNGTLLTPDTVRYLSENNFGYSISIDGNKESHDKYRVTSDGKGSFDTIIRNINNLDIVELIRANNDANIRMTISDENYKVDECIKLLLKITPVRKFTFGIDSDISKSALNKFLKHLDLMCENYAQDIKNNNYYDVTNITAYMLTLISRRRTRAHCNAGAGYFTLANDGKIHLCHRFTGKNELAIADINSLELLEEHSKSWGEKLHGSSDDRINECKKCAFNKICGGSCFYEAYHDNEDMISYSVRFCKIKKGLFKNMLKLTASLARDERSGFVNYLQNESKNINL
ncbi:hypothetical protein BST55_14870 [Vibrio vulnificus]|uniref:radical SAM/SPASM domain-containing protein n=1 Tax=Vibrio vulnificus TaxID=672 RepID=UPI000B9FD5A3|nr:radical SAM protein [Vibrio vulnificus]EGR8988701.1 SPASM domain-containing protein [Vibrio vulnificus]EKK9985644.1 SPASM domain-containing protein [Vibrio vulnificus]ELA3116749.1 SPASM domain-containing protein [Vibrio vulnificus]ELQ2337892.1 SPASM domain-containing protein [Vibrio vulnificus]ELQ2463174.1 SPASM domain-containing protein [Vibrio vulnificus]